MLPTIAISSILLPLIFGFFELYRSKKSGLILLSCLVILLMVHWQAFLKAEGLRLLSWEWLPGYMLSLVYSTLTTTMAMLVLIISITVVVYASWYMKTDRRKHHFFAFLGFFVSAMLGLLFAHSLLLTFIFWEFVGLASYLLIGFWYQKEDATAAARTAFMVNRVADVLLLSGILWVMSFEESTHWQLLPSLLIALGAIGKSAQLPYSGWIIGAMAGPTPASALIHAATMVAAGVFVLFQWSAYFHPIALQSIGLVGGITMLYGGFCAIYQFNLKRILAYSTISQLGFMVLAIGFGAKSSALFHLWTHAFFKAGLFLAAASIIKFYKNQGSAYPEDIRMMGGLRHQQPQLFVLFLLFCASLMGLPFTGGFFSKEDILNEVMVIPWIGFMALASVPLTAFYTHRMMTAVFLGDRKGVHRKEEWLPTISLGLLALGSIWVFYSLDPLGHHSALLSIFGTQGQATVERTILSMLLILGGMGLSHFFYIKRPYTQQKLKVVLNGFYINRCYHFVGFFFYRLGLGIGRGFICRSPFIVAVESNRSSIKIDSLLHAIVYFVVLLSKILAFLEHCLVDGLIRFFAYLARFIGGYLAQINAPRVQVQLLWMVAFLILMIVIIFVN